MKKLLVIRHAKSDWGGIGMNDFDRSLNDRGNKDASAMAQKMIKRNIEIDAFISSPANRALTTAKYFVNAFNNAFSNSKKVVEVASLYHAPPEIFYELIAQLDNELDTVAIFAHNPGITEFVNELTTTKIDDMPTCGIFGIEINSNKWSDFSSASKTFWFVDYPKK